MSTTIEEKMAKHKKLQAQLKELKKEEMDLRTDIVTSVFRSRDFGKKVLEFSPELYEDYQQQIDDAIFEATINKGKDIGIDKEAFDYDLLDNDEKEAITFTPKLSKTVYNKLFNKKNLQTMLIEKPTAPTVSYKLKVSK